LIFQIEVLSVGPVKVLNQEFSHLFDSKVGADVTLKIGDQTMLVHKAILSGN
jgi:hypothetical protein